MGDKTSIDLPHQGVVDSYLQTFNVKRTKYQNLNVSLLVLNFPLPNPLKPSVKLKIKMRLIFDVLFQITF